jgi:hypothetical protein
MTEERFRLEERFGMEERVRVEKGRATFNA